MLTSSPPPLLVLNEPETNLHPQLLASLAKLIAHASRGSQIFIVSHSEVLAQELERNLAVTWIELVMEDGRTRLAKDLGSKRVWSFDDQE